MGEAGLKLNWIVIVEAHWNLHWHEGIEEFTNAMYHCSLLFTAQFHLQLYSLWLNSPSSHNWDKDAEHLIYAQHILLDIETLSCCSVGEGQMEYLVEKYQLPSWPWKPSENLVLWDQLCSGSHRVVALHSHHFNFLYAPYCSQCNDDLRDVPRFVVSSH